MSNFFKTNLTCLSLKQIFTKNTKDILKIILLKNKAEILIKMTVIGTFTSPAAVSPDSVKSAVP